MSCSFSNWHAIHILILRRSLLSDSHFPTPTTLASVTWGDVVLAPTLTVVPHVTQVTNINIIDIHMHLCPGDVGCPVQCVYDYNIEIKIICAEVRVTWGDVVLVPTLTVVPRVTQATNINIIDIHIHFTLQNPAVRTKSSSNYSILELET